MKILSYLLIAVAAMMPHVSFADSPRIVAHRGYWDTEGSAQNSIRSLVKADSIGCWGSEFDVWLTKDNRLVLNHDGVIDGHVVQDETLDELSAVRLENGEPLPTLEQFLDTAATLGIQLVLELKEHRDTLRELEAVEMIGNIIRDRNLQERTTFITFSRPACKAFVDLQLCPVYYLSNATPQQLAQMGVTGPDFNQGTLRKHPEWVAEFRRMGMPINVWTVTKAEDLDWAIEQGFDFITTNAPEEALSTAHKKETSYSVTPALSAQPFDGWGVSLCWWAKMTGEWTDEAIDRLVDWLVSPDGLNYNIFRYNIGGGDDPEWSNCDAHHMGKGKGLRAEMDGFKDGPGAQYAWHRDAAQRKIMLKIKEKRPDAVFEAFSNSAPWWMTHSGCVGGHADPNCDNLNSEYYEEFAHYLVDICMHYKNEHGIEFKTLEPFNEPMTDYWYRNGSQEGCHFDVSSMIDFVRVLHPILMASGLNTGISVADETDVRQSVKDFHEFRDAGILGLVAQFNTHTYEGNDSARIALRELCDKEGLTLWQSETGSGGRGIAGNLSLAQRLVKDMRLMSPSAWLDWQYVDAESDQWCLVKAEGFKEENCRRIKNYYIRSHFSRFIKQGYTMLTTDNDDVLAATNPEGSQIVLVAVNNSRRPSAHNADLSSLGSVGNPKGYITDRTRDLAPVDDCSISDAVLNFTLPPHSIATFIVAVQ